MMTYYLLSHKVLCFQIQTAASYIVAKKISVGVNMVIRYVTERSLNKETIHRIYCFPQLSCVSCIIVIM